ncbi:MAG: YceD family protein [Candidatus Limnocylindrales bacterium]
MLEFNVAGLLGSVPGTERRYEIRDVWLHLPDDLQLALPLNGTLRLSRTSRSILVDAELDAALAETCSRCLKPAVAPLHVTLREEALPSIDLRTGLPVDTSAEPDALRIDDHHVLDLGIPVGEAISMAEPIAPLCRPDCRGLCPVCGADLNEWPDHVHPDDRADIGLAALGHWPSSESGDPAR